MSRKNEAASLFRIYEESAILVNMSVWTSIEALHDFTYRTNHVNIFRSRQKWFAKSEAPSLALWWMEQGQLPSVEEGKKRLEHLRQHGPSRYAFTFKERYPMPGEDTGG